MKADLHNHLRTSSRLDDKDFNKAIDIASQRLGVNGIFAMVNFSDDRYERFIQLRGYERIYVGENSNGVYIPEKKLYVVKGQEIPTERGHLLILGTSKDYSLKENKSLEDSLKEASDNNGIIVADHPFYRDGVGFYLELNPKLIENFDAFETFNGEASLSLPFGNFPRGVNKKAMDFYISIKKDYPKLGALSSSDGHSFYEIGKSWTELISIRNNINGNFINDLRFSINQTSETNNRQNSSSRRGAVDHILDLIWICKIAPKIKLDGPYKIK